MVWNRPHAEAQGRRDARCPRRQPSRVGDSAWTGVVDGQLKVYGVEHLRVGDASVFPTLPSGNSHASCMMVGERAAEFMIRDSNTTLKSNNGRH